MDEQQERINEKVSRKYPEAMSWKCEIYLGRFFTTEQLEEGLKDPKKFVKENITPAIKKEQRDRGVGIDVLPLVLQKTRNGKPYLILSSETE